MHKLSSTWRRKLSLNRASESGSPAIDRTFVLIIPQTTLSQVSWLVFGMMKRYCVKKVNRLAAMELSSFDGYSYSLHFGVQWRCSIYYAGCVCNWMLQRVAVNSHQVVDSNRELCCFSCRICVSLHQAETTGAVPAGDDSDRCQL